MTAAKKHTTTTPMAPLALRPGYYGRCSCGWETNAIYSSLDRAIAATDEHERSYHPGGAERGE